MIVGLLWLCLAMGLAGSSARAQPLDKVAFGTNWVAQGEHGGFYQALADGTYRKHGLDVTIVPGGPNVNNRLLLPTGRIDFFMSANTLQMFDAVENNIPTVSVAAIFQKEPQVFIAHPDQGFDAYSTLIETRRDLVERKPDLVQRFVNASVIGWANYLYGDNKAANAIIRRHNPEMADALLAYSVATMRQHGIVDSGDTG